MSCTSRAFSASASCCHPAATVRSSAISVVGRGQQHVVRHGVLEQRGVVLERGGQQRVAGDEGDDELGRVVELLPVGLLRQRVDVGPQLPGVDDEVGAPVGVVGGVVGVEERLERHLGVDHHLPGPRQASRPCRAGAVRRCPSVVTCCSKSQCSTIPAISTTRRNCISPHRPRVAGERSAVTRLRVSDWSLSWDWVRRPDLLAQTRCRPSGARARGDAAPARTGRAARAAG